MALAELAGSPEETRDEQAFTLTAVRRFQCPWAERYTHRGTLLTPPTWAYPYAATYNARAVTCTIKGVGKTTVADGLLAYPVAILEVTYRTAEANLPGEDPDTGELVTETFEATVEFITLDHVGLNWGPDIFGAPIPLRPDEAPGIQIHGHVYSFARHNLANIPQEMVTHPGSVNSLPIQSRRTGSPRLTYSAEQCLYTAPTFSIEHKPDGTECYSADQRWICRNIPSWNKFFRARNFDPLDPAAAWRAIFNEDNVQVKPYPVRDHSALLGL